MMLWLLATLSVVTISWGIAHRLKAASPAANCTGERCSCRPEDARDLRTAAASTEAQRRFANPRTGHTPPENPNPGHYALGEQ